MAAKLAGSRQPAGQGFAAAAALTRGMGDLSMSGAALDETTNYEFKENFDDIKQQTLEDIDDFERRLEGSAVAQVPRAGASNQRKTPAMAAGKSAAAAPLAKKSGAEYVKSARQSTKPLKKKGDDDDDDADDVKQAMSDLAKFEEAHGAASDDD